MTYYLNGKIVDKKDIPDDAKLIRVVNEEHYADDAYIAKQNKNSYNFFKNLAQQREELEQKYG